MIYKSLAENSIRTRTIGESIKSKIKSANNKIYTKENDYIFLNWGFGVLGFMY